MEWDSIIAASVTLFLVMDPLGNMPIFNSVLGRLSEAKRTRIIIREVFIALVILLTLLFTGNSLLSFLGLSQVSLNIAGGVLLFIISLKLIFPPSSRDREDLELDDDPLIVPLAIPLFAGPSTIAVLLLLSSTRPEQTMHWVIALLLAWAISSTILVLSPYILSFIGKKGSRAMERLMGMILVILSVQMLLDGLKEFLQSLSV